MNIEFKGMPDERCANPFYLELSIPMLEAAMAHATNVRHSGMVVGGTKSGGMGILCWVLAQWGPPRF